MVRVRDYGSRKDDNHREIKKYFEGLGCYVKDVSSIPGFVDLLVKRGTQVRLVEVKDPTKKPSARMLTKSEKQFWSEFGEDPLIVETQADVIRVVEGML